MVLNVVIRQNGFTSGIQLPKFRWLLIVDDTYVFLTRSKIDKADMLFYIIT